MIIEAKEKQEKLRFFQDLYNEAYAATEVLQEKFKKHYEQYKGSTAIDGSSVPAKQVRNITYELVESQVTSYIPTATVTPKNISERSTRCAKAIEVLLSNKRDELPFEKMNDLDERYNPIYGGSVWLVEWDESIVSHNTVGDVKVTCLSPVHFAGQPNIYEIRDMEYCFIKFETTKEDIVRKYGVSVSVAEESESDESADDKTATLYVCYYKNEMDKLCQYIWSGDEVLLDIDDYYARKKKVCVRCGKREGICACESPKYKTENEEYEELEYDIVRSDGSVIPVYTPVIENGQYVMETKKEQLLDDAGNMEFDIQNGIAVPMMLDVQVPKMQKTRLPFYTPNIIPIVIRKNTSEEDSLFGQSDCEFIRPQQQSINKIESRILEKLLKSGVYPLVPEEFSGTLDSSIHENAFRVKPNEVGQYGRLDLQVDISRDIAEAERLYDQAKRILGITDSFQGQYDSSAQSGRAKALQIQQAAGRLDSKRQMKNAAYAEIDEIIFQYYLAYADEPRPAAFRDALGMLQNCEFNRYDFLCQDEAGEWYYDDRYLFRTDASMDIEKSRETLWAENRQNFQSGAYGDPSSPETQLIFWLCMERAHYPFAHDNVERIREVIKKQNQLVDLQEENAILKQDIAKRAEYEGTLIQGIKQITEETKHGS